METAIEEELEELKDIDEFFTWDEDEDEDEFYNEYEQLTREKRSNELLDYANDIRNKLKQRLSGVQTREPRYVDAVILISCSQF